MDWTEYQWNEHFLQILSYILTEIVSFSQFLTSDIYQLQGAWFSSLMHSSNTFQKFLQQTMDRDAGNMRFSLAYDTYCSIFIE